EQLEQRGSNYVSQGHQLFDSQKENRKLKRTMSRMQSEIDELRVQLDTLKAEQKNRSHQYAVSGRYNGCDQRSCVESTHRGKHGNLKLKHGSSDTSFERAHLVELNSANRISKGLSNKKWRVVLGTHCEVHYALPFLTGSSYSDAVGSVSLYYPMCFH
ncbi:hypothetical protein J6590_103435, partial [Homalodisca vitripennis]